MTNLKTFIIASALITTSNIANSASLGKVGDWEGFRELDPPDYALVAVDSYANRFVVTLEQDCNNVKFEILADNEKASKFYPGVSYTGTFELDRIYREPVTVTVAKVNPTRRLLSIVSILSTSRNLRDSNTLEFRFEKVKFKFNVKGFAEARDQMAKICMDASEESK